MWQTSSLYLCVARGMTGIKQIVNQGLEHVEVSLFVSNVSDVRLGGWS